VLIASSTITSDRAAIIGDALRSVVAYVDLILIVDLGITDATLEIAREIAGEKLRVVRYEGPLSEVGAMRNLGLDECTRLGAEWCLTLDTDERMEFGPGDYRAALAGIGTGIVYCPMDGGRYTKERFVHLPVVDRFQNCAAHEHIYPWASKQTILPMVSCRELPKTPEQLAAKCSAMVPWLTAQTQKEPKNPRWWYYLGDALAGLGRDQEAIKAFDVCSSLRGWDEESAWACFRMAILLEMTGRRQDAISICAAGLTRHAGMSELAWFAGELSLRAGQAEQAVYWARLATVNGTNQGEDHFIKPRIGFRYPAATKHLPFDLMARAYKALGRMEEAARSTAICHELEAKNGL